MKLLAVLLCMVAWPAYAVDCIVGEYGGTPSSTDGVIPVALTMIDSYKVTFTSTSTPSQAFQAATLIVRVKCTAKTHFLIDTAPVADTNDQWVGADETEYFGAVGGQKIAFIGGS